MKALLLQYFNPELQIRVETDASSFAISGIISQLQEDDGHWHPIAFWLWKMTDIKTHYEAYNRELLAIIEIFKHWWHYLKGSRYPVVVKSNHANLQAFMDLKMKRLNRHQARWVEMLAVFDFIIKHHPGTSNPADALSQMPNYKPTEGEVLEDTLLPML